MQRAVEKAAGDERVFFSGRGSGTRVADEVSPDTIPDAAGGEDGHRAATPEGVTHRYSHYILNMSRLTVASPGSRTRTHTIPRLQHTTPRLQRMASKPVMSSVNAQRAAKPLVMCGTTTIEKARRHIDGTNRINRCQREG